MILRRFRHQMKNYLVVPNYAIRFSRQQMQYEDEGRQKQKQQKNEIIKANYQQTLKKLKFNDQYSQNCIKVRVNHDLFRFNKNNQEQQTIQNVKNCWIIQQGLPKPPKVLVSAIRKYIITSIKKATIAMKIVKKKYVFDAIQQLKKSHKKVAKVMIPTFYNLIDHARQKGLNPYRLFVHGCIIGKTKRYKGVRYHAKGRGCVQKRDFCQVKVILEERNEQQFYSQIANGHCPPGLAKIIRQRLLERNASFEDLVQYTGLTTAKGRQQAREILKRKTDLQMLKNEQQGRYEPKKIVFQKYLKQRIEKVKLLVQSIIEQQENDNLRKRQILFKKNQQSQ